MKPTLEQLEGTEIYGYPRNSPAGWQISWYAEPFLKDFGSERVEHPVFVTTLTNVRKYDAPPCQHSLIVHHSSSRKEASYYCEKCGDEFVPTSFQPIEKAGQDLDEARKISQAKIEV